MRVFSGDNPSLLYLEGLNTLFCDGENCSPRGKPIKELTPVTFEFFNPLNRVTFLRGRSINPFFQLAESLWIISGRADVEFLDLFNKNMKNFSDDKRYFNAPYGERIRTWGVNSFRNQLINPIDQLEDAYIKLSADRDTRQATLVISNPHYDNSSYTLKGGLDIACNLVVTFKIRHDELNMMVVNRSNDIIYGLFGANLCQFSTLQELLANWLGVKVGTYTHVTDSLHTYLDSYGSGENEKILGCHEGLSSHIWDTDELNNSHESKYFVFKTEPRMSSDKNATDKFLSVFWASIYPMLTEDYSVDASDKFKDVVRNLQYISENSSLAGVIDDYWKMAIGAMFAYRFIRAKEYGYALDIIRDFVPNSSWKVAMLYFVKKFIVKSENQEQLTNKYVEIVENMGNDLFCIEYEDELEDYLSLDFTK